MNVEIEAEAAQFPEKEYINGIAVAVYNMYNHTFTHSWTFAEAPLRSIIAEQLSGPP
jgi:hypothetical protein